MVSTFVIASLVLSVPPTPSAHLQRDAYQEAQAQAGRDPNAQVRLALWCEAHGLAPERLRHLALAILADPSNAAARGLMGLVAYRGEWKRPETIAADAKTDDALQALLAEYNARREAMTDTADAHWNLGLWCEQKRLRPEALAHFTAVTRLDPHRSDAWQRLGCENNRGRWLSKAQVAAERAEADAQKLADQRWGPRLKAWWKQSLADTKHRAETEAAFGETLESRAVPAISHLFSDGTPEQQLAAVSLLNHIDSVESTRELAWLAAAGRSGDVRQSAADALARRDPNEVIEPLVGLLRTPMGVSVNRGGGRNTVAELRVEDEQVILRKVYVQRTQRVTAGAGRMNIGFLAPIFSPRASRTASQQLSRDVRAVQNRNRARTAVNESAREILVDLTGQDVGPEPESWRRWLSEQQGYAYTPSTSPKRLITRVSQHAQVQFASAGFHSYCFGKGTPVRTLIGLEAIEHLRVGDQVLAEDVGTGRLSFQPVVVAYHNPPSPTLKITLEHETIVSTPIHRFWGAGRGWVLARDLKLGDTVRVLGGLAKVAAIDPGEVQPVFNLELAGEHSFFVGTQGALVHDNSRAETPSQPFDTVLAPATQPRRLPQ